VARLLLYAWLHDRIRVAKGDREAHQMAEQKQPKRRSSGFFRIFERGVDTAARNNVTAMGYSISITAAFALLQTSRSDTGIIAIFFFAAGAVLAFAIIACLASGFFREELEDESSNIKSLAGALSFLSVGLALVVTYVVGLLIPGLAAWPASAFLATVVYVASVGLELTIAHWILSSKE
jgi:small-conductance mechanosensitive channel